MGLYVYANMMAEQHAWLAGLCVVPLANSTGGRAAIWRTWAEFDGGEATCVMPEDKCHIIGYIERVQGLDFFNAQVHHLVADLLPRDDTALHQLGQSGLRAFN